MKQVIPETRGDFERKRVLERPDGFYAKMSHKDVMLEQHAVLGGLTHTFSRNDYRPAGPLLPARSSVRWRTVRDWRPRLNYHCHASMAAKRKVYRSRPAVIIVRHTP